MTQLTGALHELRERAQSATEHGPVASTTVYQLLFSRYEATSYQNGGTRLAPGRGPSVRQYRASAYLPSHVAVSEAIKHRSSELLTEWCNDQLSDCTEPNESGSPEFKHGDQLS